MTSIQKNACIDKLHDLLNKFKNAYHSAIKRKRFDVKPVTYIDLNKENNKKDSNFEVGDHVRTSKYIYIVSKRLRSILIKRSLYDYSSKGICYL